MDYTLLSIGISTVVLLLGFAVTWGRSLAELKGINRRLDRMNGRLDAHSGRLDSQGERIARLEGHGYRDG